MGTQDVEQIRETCSVELEFSVVCQGRELQIQVWSSGEEQKRPVRSRRENQNTAGAKTQLGGCPCTQHLSTGERPCVPEIRTFGSLCEDEETELAFFFSPACQMP